ncbi:MAG: hypothetical protein Q8L11_00515 [Candidatus Moranbacteria bacterium]|nr:hypothetical protein [Candidatus Moranbacteria bacterium]
MKHIQKFIRNNRDIFLVILACLLANLFLFYSKGLSREYSTNIAYLDFIKNFPQSIHSARVEPFFITVSYFLAKITGPLWSIIILKNTITVVGLYVFYKLLKLFAKNEHIALAFVIILNFSFSFFSIEDNLLRNHFATLFFLGALYYILKLFRQSSLNKKEVVIASLLIGLVIYAHILPAVIIDFSLVSIFSIITISLFTLNFYTFPAKSITKTNDLKKILSTTLLIGIFALAIQAPYLAKMYSQNVGVGDYQKIFSLSNAENKPAPANQPAITPDISEEVTIFLNDLKNSTFKLFRILFEYRLPGFPIIMMIFLGLSIILICTKRYFLSHLPLLIVWMTTYAGSKLDLILHIDTLAYRFSLMLIFPSLLLTAIIFDILITRVKNPVGKKFFSIVILFSFLTASIPIILENTILRNYQDDTTKKDSLEEIYLTHPELSAKTIFLSNGSTFDTLHTDSVLFRNDFLFSTEDENKLVSHLNQAKIKYIIFDHEKIDRSGNDIGVTTNKNLDLYQNSGYFKNLGEFIKPHLHLSIFRFDPSGKQTPVSNSSLIDCYDNPACADTFLQKISEKIISGDKLKNWSIEITQNEEAKIKEFAVFNSNEIIGIKYEGLRAKNAGGFSSNIINLKEIPIRPSDSHIGLRLKSSTFLLSTSGINIDRKNLREYSLNEVSVYGRITNNNFSYQTVSRQGFLTIFSLFCLIALIIIYILFLLHNKIKHQINSVLIFRSKNDAIIIISVIFLLILNSIFFNIFFIDFYKKIIGI